MVRAELGRLADDGITAEELERGKGQLRGGLVLGLEDTGSRMSRIGKAELVYDELPSIDEVLARIEAVTLDDVNTLARDLFRQAADARRRRPVRGAARVVPAGSDRSGGQRSATR